MNSHLETADLRTQSCLMLPMFSHSAGKLHHLLGKGEYLLLKDMPIFESDFIQINRRGEVVDVHNALRMVTVGMACTSLQLPVPDVLLLAQPATRPVLRASDNPEALIADLQAAETLELTRLLPLKFVKLSIFNREKMQFQLKLATGRSFYLQLCPPSNTKEDVFAFWEDLVCLLRPPVEAYSGTQALPAGDMISIPGLETEDWKSPSSLELHGQGDQDEASGSSLSVLTLLSDVSEPPSLVDTRGEGGRQQASNCLGKIPPPVPVPAPEGPRRGAAAGAAGTVQDTGGVVAAGETVSRPGADHVDRADAGPSVRAGPGEGNVSQPGGGQTPCPGQADAPKKKEKEKAATNRLYNLSKMWETASFLKTQGAPWGDKGDSDSSLRDRGCGALLHEYISLSLTHKGSRLSEKLQRSLSRTRSGKVP